MRTIGAYRLGDLRGFTCYSADTGTGRPCSPGNRIPDPSAPEGTLLWLVQDANKRCAGDSQHHPNAKSVRDYAASHASLLLVPIGPSLISAIRAMDVPWATLWDLIGDVRAKARERFEKRKKGKS